MKDFWDASWIIQDRKTGKAMMETFDAELCQFVDISKYRVIPVMTWLTRQKLPGMS